MTWKNKKCSFILILISASFLSGMGLKGKLVYADDGKPENANSQSTTVTAYVEAEENHTLPQPSGKKGASNSRVKTGDIKSLQEQLFSLGIAFLVIIVLIKKYTFTSRLYIHMCERVQNQNE